MARGFELGRVRPARVSAALRRRWFEARLSTVATHPYPSLMRLGTPYGGWWVPDDLVNPEWVCYSVGAGHDVSFDLELVSRYGARVRAFDPFFIFAEQALAKANGDPRFSFHQVAITASDGPVEMYGRQDSGHGSVSAANLYRVSSSFTRPGRSVPSLMSELGDEQVHLLKLDIEGSEYDVVPSLDLVELGVRVLCVELHHNEPASTARALIAGLAQQGFLPVRREKTSFTLMDEASISVNVRGR